VAQGEEREKTGIGTLSDGLGRRRKDSGNDVSGIQGSSSGTIRWVHEAL
jgi:hypothetical protein